MLMFASSIAARGQERQASVDVNLNVKHTVGGADSFDREKWMVLHARATEHDWDSAEQRASFLNDYDVYLGRDCGAMPEALSWTTEDPNKPGWCDPSSMAALGKRERARYAKNTAVHALEHRSEKMTVGGQPKMFPDGSTNGSGFVIGSYDALADFYEQYLTHFCGSGGTDGSPKPAMLEVVNEPFVHAREHNTTYEEISEFHNLVAERVKRSHPDVMVGGYTAAHPGYEDHDFRHWDRNWRLFIDIAGENMDFFSLHLYDNPLKNKDLQNSTYRSGSNVEAILDLVEHYSWLKLGEVKPFNISEYGCLRVGNGFPYGHDEAWRCTRSYNTILMQLLERPDRILQAIPFMVLKAEWGRKDGFPYPKRLLYDVDELNGKPKDNDGPWAYTPRINFWEMWKEVNGIRVDTVASDPDIQVDSYVNGSDVFVIVSSLDHTGPQKVNLNVLGASSDLLHVQVKHLYADSSGLPVLDDYTTGSLPTITLGASATAVIKYSFRSPLEINEVSSEQKYYATTYLQPVAAETSIEFEINDVDASSKFGEAVLRIGIGRKHGLSLQPVIHINGKQIPVPTDWRGYDQWNRGQFFGVLEIPVPYSLLQEDNSIVVTFPDSGGHVSSVAMQVFGFSADIRAAVGGKPEASSGAFPFLVPKEKPGRVMSAAVERAYDEYGGFRPESNELFTQFKYTELKGFDYSDGDATVSRRDPSKVIFANGKYYVWYTGRKTPFEPAGMSRAHLATDEIPSADWDLADIWYATSTDGFTWEEQGIAVQRPPKPQPGWRSVTTTDILEWEGKYYLYYQAFMEASGTRGDFCPVAVSYADSPDGPWTPHGEIVIPNGAPGEWDQFSIHDPYPLVHDGKIYLYYKADFDKRPELRPSKVRMQGLAIADHPLGPFKKHPLNPVINSGHETTLFPFKEGVAALVIKDGMERNTIQYAEDWVNFEIASIVELMPVAGGPFVPDAFTDTKNGRGITWGISHFTNAGDNWRKNYSILIRFDCDLSLDVDDQEMKDHFNKYSPEHHYQHGLSGKQRERIANENRGLMK
ncbi:hypothetical protein P4B35_17975 [Pontiellaceae bacterium B12227]|nr:hypothetical protein [Pontiellaceae bacterium B12227]